MPKVDCYAALVVVAVDRLPVVCCFGSYRGEINQTQTKHRVNRKDGNIGAESVSKRDASMKARGTIVRIRVQG